MSLSRISLRSVIDASLCRRRERRRRVDASSVKCWNELCSPVNVPVIEADVKGARLMLPFPVAPHEQVRVSFQDEMGQYQTRLARIAWTQPLACGGKFVAGMAFDEELTFAA